MMYGNLFINQHGVEDSGLWYEALRDLTPIALETGISRIIKGEEYSKYPPTAMEFRKLCQGFYEELRLPTSSKAFDEIKLSAYFTCMKWSHEVVAYTASKLGDSFWKIKSDSEAYPIFVSIYDQICSLVRQGNPLPIYVPPKRESKEKDPNVAKKHLSKIRTLLGALS